MKKIISVIVFILISFIGGIINPINGAQQVTITIIYDNYIAKESLTADWGFSCLIEGTEKTILFDTGRMSQILLNNIDSLKIDLDSLDLMILSHNHLDHTGGVDVVLDRKSEIPVYFGDSYPADFDQNIINHGATPIKVDGQTEICENVFSTGELHGTVNEQSLIIDTENGLVIITGCSHPGIVDVLKKAKEMLNKNIYLVFGGFHLLNSSDAEVNQIIQEFKTLGVEKCGATHCTGDRAINLFKDAYGENYVPMGAGQVIQIPSITTNVEQLYNEESQIPTGFRLDQNYPNPFNPATKIKYSIPSFSVNSNPNGVSGEKYSGSTKISPYNRNDKSHVDLKVYDILGREVATLVNENQIPGNYEVEFNSQSGFVRELTSGVYSYRLIAGEFAETKKMMLLR